MNNNFFERTSNSTSEKGILRYDAYSMADVYDIVNDIVNNTFAKPTTGKPIWFRGQGNEQYTLLPSLFRDRNNETNDEKMYSTISLAEEYRYQNFAARVNHFAEAKPQSRVEWQELLQHHFGKTRFMDWSESLATALNFALEPFIDTKNTKDNEFARNINTPSIWVLNPYKLNEYIYDFFAEKEEGKELIKNSLKSIFGKTSKRIDKISLEIQKDLYKNKKIYFNIDGEGEKDLAINGLVSICTLENYYHSNSSQIKEMLLNREFNPFFFLLIRYYADAFPIEADLGKALLPPLASLQPYHSERIRAQRGVFTIFPNYCRTPAAKKFINTPMDVVCIEAQKMIAACFFNIRLCNPYRIAKDLVYAGERRPELYPDIQIYADYLETEQFPL